MSREEVVKKIIEYAAVAFGVAETKITETTIIADELGVSSTQRVSVSAAIENEFDVMIPVARFGQYKTIGDLADFVLEEM